MRENNGHKISQLSTSRFTLDVLKKFILISSSGLILVILLMLIGIWRTGSRLFSGIEGFMNGTPSKPQIAQETLIIKQIRGVSTLTTSIFAMEAIVPTSQDRKLGNLVVGTTKLLYIAHGQVRAGIDLQDLNHKNVKIRGKNLTIQLPPPEILDSKIDVTRSRVYDYDRGFLGLGPDVGAQLQTLAQRETLKTIVQEACNQGILEDASDRARLVISQLFINSGYENVEVIATAPNAKTCLR